MALSNNAGCNCGVTVASGRFLYEVADVTDVALSGTLTELRRLHLEIEKTIVCV